jgi:hypothetical protein
MDQNKDTLLEVKATLHYYECVADTADDVERQATNKKMIAKLGRILQHIEEEIQVLDQKIGDFTQASTMIYDVPELKHYRVRIFVVSG